MDNRVRATMVGDGKVGVIEDAAGLYVIHETELEAYILNTAALEIIRASDADTNGANSKLVKQALARAKSIVQRE